VLREADRPTLAFATLGRQQLLTQRPFSRFEVAICHLPPGGTTGDEPYTHGDSDELVLVVSGEVVVQTGEDEHHLHTGDCVQYRSSTPHRVANTGDTPAELVWVISPPSY
jgi:mannose-6-phosphate isomerase-like protein (cupin superfamily)